MRPWYARPVALAGAIVLVLLASSLAISAIAGAHPQNDDWSYVKSAFELRHGHLRLQGWGQMFLLGQLFTSQPFLWVLPSSVLTLDAYGALAMGAFFACAWTIGRRCVGDSRALLLLLSMAVWPGMGVLTSSFMTDAPAAAGSMLALVLGLRAIEAQSRRWLVASMLAGMFAFTVREQFVVAVVAVALAALLTEGVSRRFQIDAMAGVAAVAVIGAGLEHLRHQMPNADLAPFSFASLDFSRLPPSLVPCVFTIALVVSPAAVWTMTSWRRTSLLDPGRIIGWIVGLIAVGHVLSWNFDRLPRVTLGNYVYRSGAFPGGMVGRVPVIMSERVFLTLQFIAAVSGIVIVGELGAQLARPRRLWATFRTRPATCLISVYTTLFAVFVIGLSVGGQIQFDRYLLPLFPGAGLLLLCGGRQPTSLTSHERVIRRTAVSIVVVFLAATSLITTVSADVRDAAVWRAAERLVRGGISPQAINAGLDWNGMHATTATDRPRAALLVGRYAGQHWTLIFPRSSDCYVVTLTPVRRPDWHLLQRRQDGPYGFGLSSFTVYSYHRTSCATERR